MEYLKNNFATIEGLKIHYTTAGTGPAILLIHGWPFTSLEWKKLIPFLTKSDYSVFAPDLVGCGESELPDAPKSKFEIASILNQLLELHKLNNVTILGTDIGMMVAYSLAVNFPERIGKVILGEGALPGFGLEQLMDVANGGSWHFGFQALGEYSANLIHGNEKEYHSGFYSIMSLQNGSDENFTLPFLKYYSTKKGTIGGFYHYYTLLEDGKFNVKNPNQKLKMPVLVINGENGIPQFVTEKSVNEISDNYKTVIIKNCGHTIGEDNPQETAEQIINFINS